MQHGTDEHRSCLCQPSCVANTNEAPCSSACQRFRLVYKFRFQHGYPNSPKREQKREEKLIYLPSKLSISTGHSLLLCPPTAPPFQGLGALGSTSGSSALPTAPLLSSSCVLSLQLPLHTLMPNCLKVAQAFCNTQPPAQTGMAMLMQHVLSSTVYKCSASALALHTCFTQLPSCILPLSYHLCRSSLSISLLTISCSDTNRFFFPLIYTFLLLTVHDFLADNRTIRTDILSQLLGF